MTKEEFAAKIDGNNYRNELTRELEGEADIHGLIVIYGSSDDLMELRGALNEEIGAWDGGIAKIYLTSNGDLRVVNEEDFYEFSSTLDGAGLPGVKSVEVEALWDPEELECSWLIKTELPHAAFDILEDGELYCRGIVLDVKDIKSALE